MVGEAPREDNDAEIELDYVESDELHPCSLTDTEDLVTPRPKYFEFNEDVDMNNPKFNIGMKFRDFKQFKDALSICGLHPW